MSLRTNFAILITAVLATTTATFTACSYNRNSYSCFSDIDPHEGWDYSRAFVYMPETADSIARGRMCMLVRHTNDYPYSNLWVELESRQPADSGHLRIVRDTFCIELADIYGNWYGRGSGTTRERIDTLSADFPLISGSPLRLRHVMRPDRVEGIEKVGLIFEPFNSTDNEQ